MPDVSLADRLCDRYYPAVYRYILRAVGRADVAADLTQDVFVRIVRGMPRYDPRGAEVAWVFTIVRHVVGTWAAKHAHAAGLAPLDDEEQAPAPATQLVYASLHEALDALPAATGQILHLREAEGLSYRDIAEATGLTVDAVRARLARVRRHLARTVVRDGRHVADRAAEP